MPQKQQALETEIEVLIPLKDPDRCCRPWMKLKSWSIEGWLHQEFFLYREIEYRKNVRDLPHYDESGEFYNRVCLDWAETEFFTESECDLVRQWLNSYYGERAVVTVERIAGISTYWFPAHPLFHDFDDLETWWWDDLEGYNLPFSIRARLMHPGGKGQKPVRDSEWEEEARKEMLRLLTECQTSAAKTNDLVDRVTSLARRVALTADIAENAGAVLPQ